MREFAEQEVILSTGISAGTRFRCARQPFSRLWFDAVDSGQWRRFAAVGPSQSGKTLTCFVMPILYHLFECTETVVVGVPSLDMVSDKWSEDILPAIVATQYRDLLPRSGQGSKGGSKVVSVRFGNGATLRFMTGGGGDKVAAGFTARVVVMTEVDGMDTSGETSREADRVAQLEARTQSYDTLARVYMECTASVPDGRIWQEYQNGTASKILILCPHCAGRVSPEQEHLVGWQSADNAVEAGRRAGVVCPKCGQLWTEEDRRAANADCVLLHKGQDVKPDGTVYGQPMETRTLGFRWNAVNNLLTSTATIAETEWNASKVLDEESAAKKMRQFWWGLPYQSAREQLTLLDARVIAARVLPVPRGQVPANTRRLTIGIDLGRRYAHWTLLAWLPECTVHVVEYGGFEVPYDTLGEERSLLVALREFRDNVIAKGWQGSPRVPELAFVDAGWNQNIVMMVCEEAGPAMRATKGIGNTYVRGVDRESPRSKAVAAIEGIEEVRLATGGILFELDANHWKTWLHARLQTPIGQPGAMTIHQGDHFKFGKHLTAERKTEEYVGGKGLVSKWELTRRDNHWLDSTALACAAGVALGERLVAAPAPVHVVQSEQPIATFGGQRRW